jgi:hypothetical protein
VPIEISGVHPEGFSVNSVAVGTGGILTAQSGRKKICVSAVLFSGKHRLVTDWQTLIWLRIFAPFLEMCTLFTRSLCSRPFSKPINAAVHTSQSFPVFFYR